MRFCFIVLLFLFNLFLNLYGEKKVSYDILGYYNDYFAQQKAGKISDVLPYYEIKKRGKKYYTMSSVDEPILVIVDIPNGFIEFTDEGTGGGSYRFQMTLFKAKDERVFLLLNTVEFDGVIEEGKFFVYLFKSGKWESMKDRIFPKIPHEELFEKDFYNRNKSKIESFISKYDSERLYVFDLPRYGTDIKVRFKLEAIIDILQSQDEFEKMPNTEQKFIKEIQSKIVRDNFLLKWNKDEGKFLFFLLTQ